MGNGNAVAASDLYGKGVRIGIYLQVTGMLLSCCRKKARGMKLTCAASMLGMLAAWTYLTQGGDISPAEAWLILGLASLLYFPANCAMYDPKAIIGETTASIALLVSMFWNVVSYFRFWTTLYKTLPQLETSHSTWIFARVHLQHWYRKYSIFNGVVMVISFIFVIFLLFQTIALGRRTWYEGKEELDEKDLPKQARKNMAGGMISGAVLGFIYFILGIICTEKTIEYNNLVPMVDLTAPGQTVPLAMGIVVFIDGFFGLISGIGKESSQRTQNEQRENERRQNERRQNEGAGWMV